MENKNMDSQSRLGLGKKDALGKEMDHTKEALVRSFIMNNCLKKSVPMKNFICDIEREMICRALKVAGGNQRIASFILGMKPTTLNEKIKKFSIRTHRKIRGKGDLKYLVEDVDSQSL